MSCNIPKFACVAVLLQPTAPTDEAVVLEDWLSCFNPSPVWVALPSKSPIVKVLAVLPDCKYYPLLIEAIALKLQENFFIKWQDKFFTVLGVETFSSSLYQLSISVKVDNTLNQNFSKTIHEQVLSYFAFADAEIPKQFQQLKESLPFSLVYHPQANQKNNLCLNIIQKSLLAPLLWGIYHQSDNFLTDFYYQDFADLNQTKSQSVIKLIFLTPTSFKQNDIVQTFPLPELVFQSLARKWNCFAPKSLHFSPITWQGNVLAYDLKTETINLKYSKEIGCLGWVKYQFKDPEMAKIASVLANFANFAGVGRKTTMGMGKTKFQGV